MLANLKILSGENAIDAMKISDDSIFVLQESIKVLIDKNEIKKAANIIKKNWLKFQCMEIVEIFMTFKIKNISDSLNRYKIISRFLKKENNLSDETKLTLAYSAYHAQVWGESQTYLNSIDREKWDERVVKLYKKVKEKSLRSIFQIMKIKFCLNRNGFVQTVILNMKSGNLCVKNVTQLIKLIGQKRVI